MTDKNERTSFKMKMFWFYKIRLSKNQKNEAIFKLKKKSVNLFLFLERNKKKTVESDQHETFFYLKIDFCFFRVTFFSGCLVVVFSLVAKHLIAMNFIDCLWVVSFFSLAGTTCLPGRNKKVTPQFFFESR